MPSNSARAVSTNGITIHSHYPMSQQWLLRHSRITKRRRAASEMDYAIAGTTNNGQLRHATSDRDDLGLSIRFMLRKRPDSAMAPVPPGFFILEPVGMA